MKPQTIILDGFSKSYAMTGWRLGYGVMPPPLAEHLTRLMTNSASCTATFVQQAGVAALEGDDSSVRTMVEEFRRRRDLLVDGQHAFGSISQLEQLGSGRGRSYVVQARRLNGSIWEVEAMPL